MSKKRTGWDDLGDRVDRGPNSAISAGTGFMVKVVIGLFIVSVVIGGLGFVSGWFGEAATVAQEEFGPEAALEKYEWFKNASAQLDKKRADIKVYEANVQDLESDYEGTPRSKWDRVDKQQLSQWKMEVSGIKASFNSLAAEYNANSAKFNWKMFDTGKAPDGSNYPLPRTIKPYLVD